METLNAVTGYLTDPEKADLFASWVLHESAALRSMTVSLASGLGTAIEPLARPLRKRLEHVIRTEPEPILSLRRIPFSWKTSGDWKLEAAR